MWKRFSAEQYALLADMLLSDIEQDGLLLQIKTVHLGTFRISLTNSQNMSFLVGKYMIFWD